MREALAALRSADWDPGAQAGDDVSSMLTSFGSWQPSLASHRGPSVLDALLGGLGGQGPERVSLHDVCLSWVQGDLTPNEACGRPSLLAGPGSCPVSWHGMA